MKEFAAKVKRLENGIWYGEGCQNLSYPKEGNDKCFEVEVKSFWFRHRNDCILELIKKYPPAGGGPILDVGGGNGFVAKAMLDAGWQVILVEPGQAGVINAKKRGVENIICGTIESSGFKKNSVPAIGVFDVVEHIKEDLQFMKRLVKVLKPGGLLYLTVPAHSLLWSSEDQYAGHFRRYSLSGLKQKLAMAGLGTVFGTYIFRILPLPIFICRALPSWLGFEIGGPQKIGKDHSKKQGLAGYVMQKAFVSEICRIAKGKASRIGASCLLAARKL